MMDKKIGKRRKEIGKERCQGNNNRPKPMLKVNYSQICPNFE